MKKSYFSIFFLFILFTHSLKAQNFEGGLFAGVSAYNGDIDVNLTNFFPQIRQTVGLFGRYSINDVWAVRGQMFYGQIYGNEKKYPTSDYRSKRGFNFNTTLNEFSIQAEWSFLNFDSDFRLDNENSFLSFYGFGGLGGINFKPKTDFNESSNLFDASADKERYAQTIAVVPFGMGTKINISDALSIGAELGIRKTFSDYLDGISKVVNSKSKDYYVFSGITVAYRFQQEGDGLEVGIIREGKKAGVLLFEKL